MATVAIGSIREQIYGTAPPRGLFCDFPLGRPLGVPDDPAFQRRVIEHAFGLLERPEPVVEDYDVVIADEASEVLVCPLPARMDPDAHPAIDEAKGLRPAYERAVAKYGNRAGAVRLLDADSIPAAIESFIRVAEGHPWKQAGIPAFQHASPRTSAATTRWPPWRLPTTRRPRGRGTAGSATRPGPAK